MTTTVELLKEAIEVLSSDLSYLVLDGHDEMVKEANRPNHVLARKIEAHLPIAEAEQRQLANISKMLDGMADFGEFLDDYR